VEIEYFGLDKMDRMFLEAALVAILMQAKCWLDKVQELGTNPVVSQ
jgi:hypothetical protein